MKYIKLFSSYHPEELEDECNKWLVEHWSVKTLGLSTTCSHNGMFMISILYETQE